MKKRVATVLLVCFFSTRFVFAYNTTGTGYFKPYQPYKSTSQKYSTPNHLKPFKSNQQAPYQVKPYMPPTETGYKKSRSSTMTSGVDWVAMSRPEMIVTPAALVFNADLPGIRKYMDEVLKSGSAHDLKIYEELNPYVSGLEKNNRTARHIAWGGLAVGIPLLATGTILGLKDKELFPSLYLSLGGLGALLTTLVVSSHWRVDRDDITEFVNKHNRANTKFPLHFGVHFEPGTDRYAASIGFSF